MAQTPNAIAGSQAPVEPDPQLEQPGVEPETPTETVAGAGEGDSETPVESGAGTEKGGTVEEPTEAVPVEPVPRKSDVQKRIDALTRRRYQLETQNTQLQNELEDIRRRMAQPGAGQVSPSGSGVPSAPAQIPIQNVQIDPAQLGLPPRPKKEQFETNDAFLENMAMWQSVYEVRRQSVVQRYIDNQNQQIAEQNRVIGNWNASLEKARNKYDDFDDVVGADLMVPQAAFTAIIDSDIGTDIAYHIATHPEIAQRLNKLTSTAAVMREIGKLEAKLAPSTVSTPAPAVVGSKGSATPGASGTAKPPVATASPTQIPQAPQATKPKPKTSLPITPVGTSRPVSGSAGSTKDPNQMTYREYKAWREESRAKR